MLAREGEGGRRWAVIFVLFFDINTLYEVGTGPIGRVQLRWALRLDAMRYDVLLLKKCTLFLTAPLGEGKVSDVRPHTVICWTLV